ncbi:MAG: hypothetical protein RR588_00450 [Solibacillus sp.]
MAYKAHTKEFDSKEGNSFTFQTVPNSKQAEILDKGTDFNGKVLNAKMMPLMLENVVVVPSGLKMDDFDTWAELEEVTNAAFSFLRKRQ